MRAVVPPKQLAFGATSVPDYCLLAVLNGSPRLRGIRLPLLSSIVSSGFAAGRSR